jgi:hypothetical protein
MAKQEPKKTQHPGYLRRRHRHHEPQLLQRRSNGLRDAQHRPADERTINQWPETVGSGREGSFIQCLNNTPSFGLITGDSGLGRTMDLGVEGSNPSGRAISCLT